jgi:hypothetical protein
MGLGWQNPAGLNPLPSLAALRPRLQPRAPSSSPAPELRRIRGGGAARRVCGIKLRPGEATTTNGVAGGIELRLSSSGACGMWPSSLGDARFRRRQSKVVLDFAVGGRGRHSISPVGVAGEARGPAEGGRAALVGWKEAAPSVAGGACGLERSRSFGGGRRDSATSAANRLEQVAASQGWGRFCAGAGAGAETAATPSRGSLLRPLEKGASGGGLGA